MIKKFTQIKSVGKFRAFQAKDDISFKEFTLIYADNGSGKTAMTSIIRSLINSDHNLVNDRKSTNSQDDIFIQLLVDEEPSKQKTITFSKDQWSSSMSNIEIFDCFFIHDNIYSGFEFSNDHQKRLYNFVLGEEGVNLTELLVKNKSARSKIEGNFNVIEEKIKSFIPIDYHSVFSLKEFLKIKAHDLKNIDIDIAEAEKDYNQSLNNTQIIGKETFREANKIDLKIDFVGIGAALIASPESLQSELLQDIFDDHIGDLCMHGIEDATTWVQSGFDYLITKHENNEDMICPFCTGNIEKNSTLIIKAYFQKFNEKFNNYMHSLREYKTKTSDVLSKLILIEEKWIQYRDNLYYLERYWKEYIPGLSLNVYEIDVQYLNKKVQQIHNDLSSKIEDPSKPIKSSALEELFSIIEIYNSSIYGLNEELRKYNSMITGFKSKLKGRDEAKDYLNQLNIKSIRFSKEINICCLWYKRQMNNKKNLETQYTDLSKRQAEESNQLMSRYGESVNRYLSDVFMTPFNIEKISHQAPIGKSKEPRVDYSLNFDGKEISLKQEGSLKAKYSLSEGDKSTIALSFFLAKIDSYIKDGTIKDKIIVFDDPLSSLDYKRRFATVKQIVKILPKARQIIVLSHHDSFIHELYCDRTVTKTRKSLAIIPTTNQSLIASSSLGVFDIVDHVNKKDDLYKSYNIIKSFIQQPLQDQMHDCMHNMRIALESAILKKHGTLLAKNNMTFTELIRELKLIDKLSFRGGISNEDVFLQLEELDEFCWTGHHGKPNLSNTDWSNNINNIPIDTLVGFSKKILHMVDYVL